MTILHLETRKLTRLIAKYDASADWLLPKILDLKRWLESQGVDVTATIAAPQC